MKPGIHPAYEEVNVTCACGHKFRTRSAHKGDIRVEICSSCHPFFTGKQKLIDTEGRVDRFQKKYQKVRDAAEAKGEPRRNSRSRNRVWADGLQRKSTAAAEAVLLCPSCPRAAVAVLP